MVRLNIFISPQQKKELNEEAKELGITKSILSRMIITKHFNSKKNK